MASAGPPSDEKCIQRIVRQIADSLDASPTEMAPLSDAVDPDAIAALVGDSDTGTLRITFEYAGHEVRVDAEGDVAVEPMVERAR